MTKICCIQIVFTSFYYGCIVAAVIEVDFCACHSTFCFFGTTDSNLHCLLAYCLICMIFKGTTLEDTTVHSSAAATGESITKKPVSRSYLMPPPAYPPSKPSSGITKTSIAPSSSEVPVLYRLSPSPMKGSSGDLKGGESIKASTASKAQLSASNKVPIKASSAISKGSGSIATKSFQKKQIDQEDEDDDSSTIVVGVQQGVNLDHAEDSAAAAALMKLGGRGTTSGTPTSTTRMKMLEERNSRRGVAHKNYQE